MNQIARMWLTVGLAAIGLFPNSNRCHAAGRTNEKRPNVVFVLIDDMGYGDLSCTGNAHVLTENIDRLAADGMLLTQFYVASPICSPSRVGFTTGQFPARHGVHSYLASRKRNRERGMRDFLNPDVPCIARAFQSAGYATAHFGKWHMGGGRDVDDAPLPSDYGFDRSLVSFEGLGDRVLPPGGARKSAELGRGKIYEAEKYELTETYVNRAIDFIETNKEQPFYLHLWFNDVHDAHKPREEHRQQYAKFEANPYLPKFFGVLDEMDRQIGRLVQQIDDLGLRDDTIILITSDNGPTAWKKYYREGHNPPGDTAGLRGRKWSLYEGGIRMPLVVRWPKKIPAGHVNETTVMTAVDFFPTLCTLANVDVGTAKFDGENLSAAFGSQTPRRKKRIMWEYGRDSSYLAPGLEYDQSPNLAIRDGDWKLLGNHGEDVWELYDLSNDPHETNNVAATNEKVVAKMSKRLIDWRQSIPKFD